MDLKIKDVAELLNVSETTIRRWLTDGKIPAYRLNHQYRFSRIEIENWMMSCKLKQSEEGFSPFAEEQIYPPSSEENQPKTPLSQRGGMQPFSLYRAIHKGGVFNQIPGETKEEVICGTMKLIAQRLGLDADVLSELLLDREKLMPTAFNHGIAVPHTRDFLLQDPFDMIIVVFPRKPIEYGALDGLPVHTLFFLFSSADKRHLHLLAKLAHLSSNEQALEMLRSKPGKKKLLEFIREWESQIRHY
ncbi:MAG: PTS sugar transporter subunit IIA [Anaerolineae bacterium]